MRVTIAICTWNRSAGLKITMESLMAMQIPQGIEWEVLVINNNSNDDTDVVVDSFADRLPVRRITERNPGLSNARNAGARAARGQYLMWTDDDVVVGPAWLAAYCAAFDAHPDAALFGGPVHPKFQEPIPDWLARGWRVVPSAFAGIDFGSSPLSLTPDKLPYGANFAVRREELLVHFFNPKLGASPTCRYYAEETTFMLELLRSGATGWWVPDAPVTHCIPRERMTLAYIKSYFVRTGQTDYYLNWSGKEKPKLRLLGRPLWVWRNVVESEAKYWFARAFLPIEQWLLALRKRSTALGAFDESRR